MYFVIEVNFATNDSQKRKFFNSKRIFYKTYIFKLLATLIY